jgi:hypothetical protein
MTSKIEPVKQAVHMPTDDQAIIFGTEDGGEHQFVPFSEQDPLNDNIRGNLMSSIPGSEDKDTREASVPRKKIIESKPIQFIIEHKKGEAVAAVSIGAIVVGSLFVKRLRKKH